jgi:hypothetical protein
MTLRQTLVAAAGFAVLLSAADGSNNRCALRAGIAWCSRRTLAVYWITGVAMNDGVVGDIELGA